MAAAAGALSRPGAVALNVTGQVAQNLAAILMSRGQQGRPPGQKGCIWYVGISLLVPGAVAVFASYGFAEQSLLGSLISVQFVSNMLFSRLILGRPITLMLLCGTSVIVGGTVLCILNAPRVDREFDDEDLWGLYLENRTFLHFLLCQAVLWILIDKVYTTYRDAQQRGEGLWGWDVILPCCFVARAALPGSCSIVAAKNLAILLRLTFGGRNMFGGLLLWLNLGLWLGGTTFWMQRMNRALLHYDGAFVIPLCQVNWSFFTIITGGFFFREFEHFSPEQLVLFVLGVCANFLGVMLLRPARKVGRPEDIPEGQDEELPAEKDGEHPELAVEVPPTPHSVQCATPLSTRSRRRPQELLCVEQDGTPRAVAVPGLQRSRSHRFCNTGLIPLVLEGDEQEQPTFGVRAPMPPTGARGRVLSRTLGMQSSGTLGVRDTSGTLVMREASGILGVREAGEAGLRAALLGRLREMEEANARRDEERARRDVELHTTLARLATILQASSPGVTTLLATPPSSSPPPMPPLDQQECSSVQPSTFGSPSPLEFTVLPGSLGACASPGRGSDTAAPVEATGDSEPPAANQ